MCRGDPEAKAEYDAIASAVFSNPPLASVGLSEEDATEQFGDVDVFTSSFKYDVHSMWMWMFAVTCNQHDVTGMKQSMSEMPVTCKC